MTIRVGFRGSEPGGSRHFRLLELQRVNGPCARSIIVGYQRYGRTELAALRDDGVRLRLWALGVISFTPDVSPALIDDVFESFTVHGWVRNRPHRHTATTVET